MYDNKKYWENRTIRAQHAKNHHAQMLDAYDNEINNSVAATSIYNDSFILQTDGYRFQNPAKIVVSAKDTVSAIIDVKTANPNSEVAALNFASYKNAGGCFLGGSRAQEESLCHESNLYEILIKKQNYYDWNSSRFNKGLYTDRALYSPGVIFERNEKRVTSDIITCAAPNRKASLKCFVSDEANRDALCKRAQFVVDIAIHNHVDILILGAWGCGVFGQDPEEVANAFKKAIEQRPNAFDTVVFAIPSEFHQDNFNAFKAIFSQN